MDDLSYVDEHGNTVFTSEYYRKRKTCCKSNCLHCPYGYTLKNVGVIIQCISTETELLAKQFFDTVIDKKDLSSILLSGAFKSKHKAWKKENYKTLHLKGFFIGLAEFDSGVFKKHYLDRKFNDQGITDGYIRSVI